PLIAANTVYPSRRSAYAMRSSRSASSSAMSTFNASPLLKQQRALGSLLSPPQGYAGLSYALEAHRELARGRPAGQRDRLRLLCGAVGWIVAAPAVLPRAGREHIICFHCRDYSLHALEGVA